MRALVTGGLGFIGSHLVDRLVREHWSVVVHDTLVGVDPLTYEYPPWKHNNAVVTYHSAEATIPFYMDALEGVDVVFHLGAKGSVPFSVARPEITHAFGPTSTLRLLEACKNVGCVKTFVFAGSSSVYGKTSVIDSVCQQLQPMSPYAASKVACEAYAHAYCNRFDVCSLRYFNVYGPRQRYAPGGAVVPNIIKSLLDGKPVEIHGDGEQFRYFAFVDDVVDANIKAAKLAYGIDSFRVYNVHGEKAVTMLELLTEIALIMDVPVEVKLVDSRAGDVKGYTISRQAMRESQRLGYRQTALIEGLTRTIAWYKEYGFDN